nr:hypothetical protein [uncultured Psychroserpens sp.]
MKRLLLILSVMLLVNCGSSDAQTRKTVKIKTFKNEEIVVNYPKTWMEFGGLDHVYFIPKKIRNSTFENEVEHVSVNKNVIPLESTHQIEKVLDKYGSTLTRNQVRKSFELIKMHPDSKFIYKIESLITYRFSQNIYKRVEYFYSLEDRLEYFTYQMRDELYNQYLDDALFIINSVRSKK